MRRSDVPPPIAPGVLLDGRFRLERALGAGGMGTVYRAVQVAMDRVVAVKLAHPQLVKDEDGRRRFLREARMTHRVDHPGAVALLDFGVTPEGRPYLVTEFVDGRSLADELAIDGPPSLRRLIDIGAQIAAALEAAHQVGLVHRDVKPENIMLGAGDRVKVLDFGLGKWFAPDAAARASGVLTQVGVVFGTPAYMAPEQAVGGELDGRADVYALGATLFCMLTGQPPYRADHPVELLALHVQAPVPDPRQHAPRVDGAPGLAALIAQCLAKAPTARPARAAEVAHRLRAIQVEREATPTLHPPTTRYQQTTWMPAPTEALPSPPPTADGQPISLTASDRLALGRRVGRPKRWALGLAGGVIAAVVAVAVIVTGGHSSTRSPATGPAAASNDPPAAVAVVPSAPPAAAQPPPVAAEITPPAPPPPGPRAPPSTGRTTTPPPAVMTHLANARAARAQGLALAQITAARRALKLAPSDREANFLLGDALVAGGDLTLGCRYLRRARGFAAATARARQVACPSD